MEKDKSTDRSIEIPVTSPTFLQTIIDSEPECVKLVAADGSLIMMNRAGLDMIQAEGLEQVKGRSIYTLVVEEYREAFKKITEGVFQGTPGNLEPVAQIA